MEQTIRRLRVHSPATVISVVAVLAPASVAPAAADASLTENVRLPAGSYDIRAYALVGMIVGPDRTMRFGTRRTS